MRAICLIISILIVLYCALPVFADIPVITDTSESDLGAAVPMGSDSTILLSAVLCFSTVSLIALLIVSAIVKKKK